MLHVDNYCKNCELIFMWRNNEALQHCPGYGKWKTWENKCIEKT